MTTQRLREELERIAADAPVIEVPDDTWRRGRRSLARGRALVGAAVVLAVAGVAGLVAWPQPDEPPVASAGAAAVPDQIWVAGYDDDVAVAGSLAVGGTAVVYPADLDQGTRAVAVDAESGDYRVLDLPRFNQLDAGDAAPRPLALTPDGSRLAYAIAGPAPAGRGEPMPTGVGILDLRSGEVTEVPLTGGAGVLVRTLSWSPDGRWLAWEGQVATQWTDQAFASRGQEVAGRIAPGATTSEPVPVPRRTGDVIVQVAVDDDGRVAVSAHDLVLWDGRVLAREPQPDDGRLSQALRLAGDTVTELRSFGSRPYTQATWRVSADGLTQTDRGPAPPELDGQQVEVLGWAADGRAIVQAAPPPPEGVSDIPPADLGLLAFGADPDFTRVGGMDSRASGMTVAGGLVAPPDLTVHRAPPEWAEEERTPWLTIGLAALGVVVLLAGAWSVLRRRQPRSAR